MNATLFMLTSALMAGADPAPVAAAPAPAVVSTGSSCGGGCSTCSSDPCRSCQQARPLVALQVELQEQQLRLQQLCFYPGLHHGVCADRQVRTNLRSAPVCKTACAPVATCSTCSTGCNSCGKTGLWTRLKAKFAKKGCDSCNTCSTCGTTTTTIPATTPEVIPAPKAKDMPKDLPKTTGGVTNLRVEPIVTPVAAPVAAPQIGNPF